MLKKIFFLAFFSGLIVPIHSEDRVSGSTIPVYETSPDKLPPGVPHAPLPNVPLLTLKSSYDDLSYTIKTNSLGFLQTTEYKGEPQLIYLLGDSLAAGSCADIDKNYGAELQKLMPQFFVANLAGASYWPAHAIARFKASTELMKRTIRGPKRDWIIFNMFLGNDVAEAEQAMPEVPNKRGNGKSPIQPPSTNFRYPETIFKNVIETTNFGPIEITMQELDELSRQQGARLLVVLIPTREMASHKIRDQIKKQYGEAVDFDAFRKTVMTILSEDHIQAIDLTDRFLAEQGELFYPAIDPHWNEKGQKFGAEIVAAELKKSN